MMVGVLIHHTRSDDKVIAACVLCETILGRVKESLFVQSSGEPRLYDCFQELKRGLQENDGSDVELACRRNDGPCPDVLFNGPYRE